MRSLCLSALITPNEHDDDDDDDDDANSDNHTARGLLSSISRSTGTDRVETNSVHITTLSVSRTRLRQLTLAS